MPIIALTGHGDDPKVVKACLEVGINKVLSKPADRVVLEKILGELLSCVGSSIEAVGRS